MLVRERAVVDAIDAEARNLDDDDERRDAWQRMNAACVERARKLRRLARDARAAPAASAHLAALLADPEALADPLALDSRGRRSRPRAPPRHT